MLALLLDQILILDQVLVLVLDQVQIPEKVLVVVQFLVMDQILDQVLVGQAGRVGAGEAWLHAGEGVGGRENGGGGRRSVGASCVVIPAVGLHAER